jgi:hypothetical protein
VIRESRRKFFDDRLLGAAIGYRDGIEGPAARLVFHRHRCAEVFQDYRPRKISQFMRDAPDVV